MDIAEIRKKAKGKTGSPAVRPSAESPAAPSAPRASAGIDLLVESSVESQPSVVESVAPTVSPSGLDRLFAGTGGLELATEEAYQTTLAAQDAQEDAGFSQFLAFQLGSEEYALDITRISEIIKPREYTDIPRVPEFILGLISLRGVVVPIFDLRGRFRLGRAELTSAARIIVCREGDVMAGLLVDCINQVIRLAADRIEPPPAVISGVDRSLVEGVGRYQGRMIILLNLASVLDVTMA